MFVSTYPPLKWISTYGLQASWFHKKKKKNFLFGVSYFYTAFLRYGFSYQAKSLVVPDMLIDLLHNRNSSYSLWPHRKSITKLV